MKNCFSVGVAVRIIYGVYEKVYIVGFVIQHLRLEHFDRQRNLSAGDPSSERIENIL